MFLYKVKASNLGISVSVMADLTSQDVPVDVTDDVRVARLAPVSGIVVLVMVPGGHRRRRGQTVPGIPARIPGRNCSGSGRQKSGILLKKNK